jgi:nickel/cobalt transporter (NicO) family protein
MTRRLMRAATAAIAALVLLPALALAHPLGNFTINHYARITIAADRVSVQWVLDMAEIPAFMELRGMDSNANGAPSRQEEDAWLTSNVPLLLDGLLLTIDRHDIPLQVVSQRLTFPTGQGGLDTLRLELDLEAGLPAVRTGSLNFSDDTYPNRIGWREVVVAAGPGIAIGSSDVPSTDHSDMLHHYPADAVTNPLAVASAHATFLRSAGSTGDAKEPAQSNSSRPDDPLAALVGGDLTPLSGLLAILLALGLGALHAISPGHGKALVAGYLIGSRGTLRQAIGLGATVAISHTAGVLVVAVITLGATGLILPERAIQWLTLLSAILVVGLGAALVRGQLRMRRRPAHESGRAHQHGHPTDHSHSHGRGHSPGHVDGEVRGPEGVGLTTRAVAGLGLVGGMVPSASALLVLLVAMSLHRLVFGVVLVIAFGLGMALVLAAISASVVLLHGRRLPIRVTAGSRAARALATLPVLSAVMVVVIGVAMTVGAAAALS